MNLNYDMKLGDAFPNLQGIKLDVEEFDLPVRLYNTLKRCDIHSLQTLLTYSCNEILEHKKASFRKDGLIDHIAYTLNKLHLKHSTTMKIAGETYNGDVSENGFCAPGQESPWGRGNT
ncbi:MAG: hypothetical protein FWC91_03425 [Defluviitaleaceae bacterium]|nr:hypothetical protein [Defluviitaleaceae bacterium]